MATYIEYFGVAGSGKTTRALAFNQDLPKDMVCEPKLEIVSIARCLPHVIAIAIFVPFLEFVLPHKTRLSFWIRIWKRLARIGFVLRRSGAFACDHGVMQDLAHVAPSRARNMVLRLCIHALEAQINPTQQSVVFIYLSIDIHEAVKRRERRQGPIDRGKSGDEMLREHSLIEWDTHLEELADQASGYAKHIEVKLWDDKNAGFGQSR